MKNLRDVVLLSQISSTDNENSTSVVDKFEKNFKWSNVYYEVRMG